MSEHTLDDLAARLEALGLKHAPQSPRADYIEMWMDDLAPPEDVGFDSHFVIYAHDDGAVGFDGPSRPETWPIIDTVRQWQASAEPAPPPAAPIRHAHDKGIDDAISRLVVCAYRRTQAETGKSNDERIYWIDEQWAARNALVDKIETARRGADLATEPEGARDGQ